MTIAGHSSDGNGSASRKGSPGPLASAPARWHLLLLGSLLVSTASAFGEWMPGTAAGSALTLVCLFVTAHDSAR